MSILCKLGFHKWKATNLPDDEGFIFRHWNLICLTSDIICERCGKYKRKYTGYQKAMIVFKEEAEKYDRP